MGHPEGRPEWWRRCCAVGEVFDAFPVGCLGVEILFHVAPSQLTECPCRDLHCLQSVVDLW